MSLLMHRLRIVAYWLCFLLGIFACEAYAATRVELVIDEPYQDRTAPWPVTTGVPFPRGGLRFAEQCRLVDDRGEEQPLQTRVAATWDRERTSIRWLTIDFIAEPERSYALEFGPDVERMKFSSALAIAEKPHLRVATGKLEVDFLAHSASAVGDIRVDLNGNGSIEQHEVMAAGSPAGEHYYLDQADRRFSSAADGEDREIVVEAQGPVRACVRVDGFYTGPQGQRIVAYRTRYHFFAGLPLVKVIDEFKIVGSTKGTRFKDIGFALQLQAGVKERTVRVDRSGAPGNQVQQVAWQPATTSVSSFQKTYRHVGNQHSYAGLQHVHGGNASISESPEQVGEWLQVADQQSAVTGSLRWFWQQFPKQWEATEDQLTLHLWSPLADPLDFGADGIRSFFGEAGQKYLLDWAPGSGTLNAISSFFYYAGRSAFDRGDVDGQGINKHHEFYLHFAPAADADRGTEFARLAALQPLALATGAWNCSTDVFGPLAARPNDSKYEATVDRIFDLGREAQDTFGDYGWWWFGSGPHYSYQWDAEAGRHYADPRRFEYHTYQKETQLWWNYLRSGERKFYDWAFPSENHWVDIAVTHVPLTYRCAWRGGFLQDQTLHMRPGDWSIDSAMHYVRQRDSAEAWLRGGSQFWASYHRTLETTTLAYYLTGDERYNDVLEFWRDYWADLAGKNSASPDFPIWHREQPWYEPTAPGEPVKTWAEMIRDYAPFISGLRHQMTQFFNLATLYEHTWDPQIGQVLDECADAYLDPEHRMGIWRSQENDLPAHADAPELAHFWVPALWKYARATQDLRMPLIFQKYFDACYAADPFREDVGRYSNVHLGYAYYYTRDPRHLRPAKLELEKLLPNAAPLAKPEDLNRRLYNPYAPIQCLTAVPRLIWALQEAKRNDVEIPPPVELRPQRTAIAVHKRTDKPLHVTLWGYEKNLKIVGPVGENFTGFEHRSKRYASELQPFDRIMPRYEVYLHEVTIPADANDGDYVFAPKLELAVLSTSNPLAWVHLDQAAVNAARPIATEPGEGWVLRYQVDRGLEESLRLESADIQSLQIVDEDGNELAAERQNNQLVVPLPNWHAFVRIENRGRSKVWFRLIDRPANACWVAPGRHFTSSPPQQTLAALPAKLKFDAERTFVEGRHGQAILVVPGRNLQLPDHVTVDGETVKLFDLEQGSIEFWVKRLWDERITPTKPVTLLTNGPIRIGSLSKLPLGEWAHVVCEWRPLKRDPSRQAVFIYVDGLDPRNYRSTWWEGYSQKPLTFPSGSAWLKKFLSQAPAGAAFAIDDLRVSSKPRYATFDVQLGGQQTFNPSQFDPPRAPLRLDEQTLMLFRFDGTLHGRSSRVMQTLTGEVEMP